MITKIFAILTIFVCLFLFLAYGQQKTAAGKNENGSNLVKNSNFINEDQNSATLIFSLTLNSEVYKASNYGEPPQIAIWLENRDSGIIRTVWVTRRLGKSDWDGRVECLTALPYWVSRYNIASDTKGPPTTFDPLSDAVTGATPKKALTVTTSVIPGSYWNYFVEVNLAADYNDRFRAMLADGQPDPDMNGQPSLIYKGFIEAVNGRFNIPVLIGRSEQMDAIDTVNVDLSGITSAKDVISKIKLSVVVE